MSGRYLKDFAVRPDLRLRSTADRKEQVRALAPKAAARASRQASDQRRKILATSSPAKWLLWVYDLTSCGESIEVKLAARPACSDRPASTGPMPSRTRRSQRARSLASSRRHNAA